MFSKFQFSATITSNVHILPITNDGIRVQYQRPESQSRLEEELMRRTQRCLLFVTNGADRKCVASTELTCDISQR